MTTSTTSMHGFCLHADNVAKTGSIGVDTGSTLR